MHFGPAAAWLAALTAAGELTFVDVCPILADDSASVLTVLRRRTSAPVHRASLSTTAGTLRTYFHGGHSPTSGRPHNTHAQRLLQRLGLGLDFCPGTFLFLASTYDHEAGLSPAQVALLRHEHLVCMEPDALLPRAAP